MVSLRGGFQILQKLFPVTLALEHRFAFIAPGCHMTNSADGFNTARTVLPAAAPRNFLRVTLGIVFPFLWVGFVFPS